MPAPAPALPLHEILNVQYALRNRSTNAKHHNSKESVPADELTEELQPQLHADIKAIAAAIVADPDSILTTSYTEQERRVDWISLKNKKVLSTAGEILPLDSRSKPGHKILDHHMRHFWDVKNYKGVNVRSLITTAAMEKALLQNVKMHSTPYVSELRRMLIMMGGLGNVTKYGAATTKAIVQYFDAKLVLDPCIGWGGRMLGTLAADTDTYYVGCEPDTTTFAALDAIVADSVMYADTDRVHLLPQTIEDSLLEIQGMPKFDMVLTSPPYFNLEIYTAGEQSTTKYPTWDDWVTKWLRPTILGCLAALKLTGTSCWSVKNFRTNKAYPLADTVKKIHEIAGWRLVKTVAMTGSARPGVSRIQEVEEELIGEDGTKSIVRVKKETRLSEEETFCFKR
jgi:hypothetical protein